ncbi:hypothetical protein D922_04112, partial [Enterococcus faecalis 06-MB-DW-09]
MKNQFDHVQSLNRKNIKKKNAKNKLIYNAMIAGVITSGLFVAETKVNAESVNVTDSTGGYEEVAPRIGINFGFTDKFNKLSADEDGIHIATAGESNTWLNIGLISQFKQTIYLDPDLADQFFLTPNYTDYISGTISRPSTFLGWGDVTEDIKDVWDARTGIISGYETMGYDPDTHSITYYTPNYLIQLSSVDIAIDLKIDLARWKEDNPRDNMVIRKDNYSVRSVTTSADWIVIGGSGTISGELSSEGIYNTWIENPVETTTLLTSDDQNFYGNGKQDLVNEHDTDYFVELLVNGVPRDTIGMDEDGNWEYDFGSFLREGDIVTARVKGVHQYVLRNGKRYTKYSGITYHSTGTDIVDYEDWVVSNPIVHQAYTGEYLVTGLNLPQNRQAGRTYDLVLTIEGQEVLRRENISNDFEFSSMWIVDGSPAPLPEGAVVEAYVIGKQDGHEDKVSSTTTMIVENIDDYDQWEVQAARVDPLKEDDQLISGSVPLQSRAYERSYNLELLVNGRLVNTEEDIPVTSRSYVFAYDVNELNLDLSYGDEVTVRVVGQQPDVANPSQIRTKAVETTVNVDDTTGYNNWVVNQPKLNDIYVGDNVITGSHEQDDTFGRTYSLDVYINGELVEKNVPINASGEFEIPLDAELNLGDEVSIVVNGHQENRDDKQSDMVAVIIQEPIDTDSDADSDSDSDSDADADADSDSDSDADA